MTTTYIRSCWIHRWPGSRIRIRTWRTSRQQQRPEQGGRARWISWLLKRSTHMFYSSEVTNETFDQHNANAYTVFGFPVFAYLLKLSFF